LPCIYLNNSFPEGVAPAYKLEVRTLESLVCNTAICTAGEFELGKKHKCIFNVNLMLFFESFSRTSKKNVCINKADANSTNIKSNLMFIGRCNIVIAEE
jgi:hypothetical protein